MRSTPSSWAGSEVVSGDDPRRGDIPPYKDPSFGLTSAEEATTLFERGVLFIAAKDGGRENCGESGRRIGLGSFLLWSLQAWCLRLQRSRVAGQQVRATVEKAATCSSRSVVLPARRADCPSPASTLHCSSSAARCWS
jgi:hypothetical protein